MKDEKKTKTVVKTKIVNTKTAIKDDTTPNIRGPLSDEHKRKISAALMGNTPWNKGKKTGVIPWNKGKRTGVIPRNKGMKMTESVDIPTGNKTRKTVTKNVSKGKIASKKKITSKKTTGR